MVETQRGICVVEVVVVGGGLAIFGDLVHVPEEGDLESSRGRLGGRDLVPPRLLELDGGGGRRPRRCLPRLVSCEALLPMTLLTSLVVAPDGLGAVNSGGRVAESAL